MFPSFSLWKLRTLSIGPSPMSTFFGRCICQSPGLGIQGSQQNDHLQPKLTFQLIFLGWFLPMLVVFFTERCERIQQAWDITKVREEKLGEGISCFHRWYVEVIFIQNYFMSLQNLCELSKASHELAMGLACACEAAGNCSDTTRIQPDTVSLQADSSAAPLLFPNNPNIKPWQSTGCLKMEVAPNNVIIHWVLDFGGTLFSDKPKRYYQVQITKHRQRQAQTTSNSARFIPFIL